LKFLVNSYVFLPEVHHRYKERGKIYILDKVLFYFNFSVILTW
jgi:hypothetical protein